MLQFCSRSMKSSQSSYFAIVVFHFLTAYQESHSQSTHRLAHHEEESFNAFTIGVKNVFRVKYHSQSADFTVNGGKLTVTVDFVFVEVHSLTGTIDVLSRGITLEQCNCLSGCFAWAIFA